MKDKKHSELQSGLIFFCCFIAMLIWGLTLNQLHKSKNFLLHNLKREQNNIIGILTENMFQALEQKRPIELLAQKWFSDHQQKSLNDITNFINGERTFNRVVLYRLSGETFYQSSPLQLPPENQEHIKYHINEMAINHKAMILNCQIDSMKTSWQMPILFPLKQGKNIQGAMLLELDIGYILNLFRDIDIGKKGNITIFNKQCKKLIRFENGGLIIESSLSEKPTVAYMQNVSGSKILQFPGQEEYCLSYKHVRNYPFIITVSQELKEFFSSFYQNTKQQIWSLSILTCFCFIGLWLLCKMINKKQQYLIELKASNAKNNELIVQLEQKHQTAVNEASFDPLTGLYNRRLFISLAKKNLALGKRNSFVYAILFIDLDRFKSINDTLGHLIGDLLLKAVAERLVDCTRKSDIVARFGGDEFVVMLANLETEQNISPIAEKIITVVSEPFKNIDGHLVTTSPSIGISIFPSDGEDIESLLENADAAMYNSKRSGRGLYSFFDTSLNTVSIQDLGLEQRMPSAIANNEFILHYQPIIRLTDFRVVGLEALIRWQHPDYHLVYPSDFIKTAEDTDLITTLDNWVLEAACQQIVKWRSAGLKVVPVAVNVSPVLLKSKKYPDLFFETLSRNQLLPENITIEVTRTAFIEGKNNVIENLEIFLSKGVRISLDNFGNGNGNGISNLNRISSLPIRTLKIDRRFIQKIRNNFNDNSIILSTIVLAKKLNLTVVATGIETHEQLVNLKVAGCDQVQGYFFSRPVPERQIREFLISPLRSIPA
ncbi:bifunctional diguanylate cyclase/phosphodiesterase [Desulfobacula toluolica]|uniref:Predicted EAL/GGDEF domain signaling protein n=1 Tax=Desulfobacula toluolica (strain DSM 7467 / Tol2) TaxID=651182 RepID=K0NQZ6_DESTT|nr:EAL domain-containing protein [Desulfobacula toluolica]CCK81362.1 predicted EAL/GGDEF domain signaling protein [Desulfobacula toluolica Tol2]